MKFRRLTRRREKDEEKEEVKGIGTSFPLLEVLSLSFLLSSSSSTTDHLPHSLTA